MVARISKSRVNSATVAPPPPWEVQTPPLAHRGGGAGGVEVGGGEGGVGGELLCRVGDSRQEEPHHHLKDVSHWRMSVTKGCQSMKDVSHWRM